MRPGRRRCPPWPDQEVHEALVTALPVPRGPQYQFNLGQQAVRGGALALYRDDLFVANYSGGSVTEVNASTGALVRVISGPQYQFNPNDRGGPDALALRGADLFVATFGGYSVTEVNASTGALVRVISGPKQRPGRIAIALSSASRPPKLHRVLGWNRPRYGAGVLPVTQHPQNT
jgi:hypothetical protein